MYTAVLMLAMVSGSETADFGGGRRGGGGCCGSYGGGGCYGGYGGGCYGGYGGCYGGYGGCYGGYGGGYRTSGYGGISSGGYYPGYAYAPSMNNVNPNAMVQNQDPNARQSFYNDPSAATIRVLLPSPDAQIWFDDTKTQQNGPERIFFTPSLQNAGKYTVKARWTRDGQTVDRQRTINVQPGQSMTVDFRQESTEKLSTPNPGK